MTISRGAIFWILLIDVVVVAKVRVVTTLPDIAWAVREIGGDSVEVESLLRGNEDPHFVDAVPSFMPKVARAQVLCSVGMDLEVGWLPKVLERSGNRRVMPGGDGFCELGRSVSPLQQIVGQKVTRAMGDVHPQGNPHFNLSPKHFGESLVAVRDALSKVNAERSQFYHTRYVALRSELEALQARLRGEIQEAVRGLKDEVKLLEYHREFIYFFEVYGLRSVGAIELVPGVPPSAGRLAEVSVEAKAGKVSLALAGSYAPESVLRKFQELSGVPVVRLSTLLPAEGEFSDYKRWQEHLVRQIVSVLRKKKTNE